MLRRSVTLSCMVMALMMTMGCTWDSGLYDKFADDYGDFEFCPTRGQNAPKNGKLAYIVKSGSKEGDNSDAKDVICCNPDSKRL